MFNDNIFPAVIILVATIMMFALGYPGIEAEDYYDDLNDFCVEHGYQDFLSERYKVKEYCIRINSNGEMEKREVGYMNNNFYFVVG